MSCFKIAILLLCCSFLQAFAKSDLKQATEIDSFFQHPSDKLDSSSLTISCEHGFTTSSSCLLTPGIDEKISDLESELDRLKFVKRMGPAWEKPLNVDLNKIRFTDALAEIEKQFGENIPYEVNADKKFLKKFKITLHASKIDATQIIAAIAKAGGLQIVYEEKKILFSLPEDKPQDKK